MNDPKDTELKQEEREQLIELGSDITKSSKGNIYTLTIIGQIEGHTAYNTSGIGSDRWWIAVCGACDSVYSSTC